MSGLAPHRYAIGRMLRRIAARPLTFVFSVLAAAAALLPALAGALLAWNLPAARTLDARPLDLPAEFSVFVAPGTPSAEVKAIQTKLQGLPAVDSVRLIARDEALAELMARDRGDGTAPATTPTITALKSNPLPDVLVVRLQPGTGADRFEEAAAAVRKWPRVDTVAAEVAWWRKWSLWRRAALGLLAAAGGIALALLAWVTVSAVRLHAAADRTELRVLHMVGATPRFARRPYVYLGAVTLGLAAALAAAGVGFALHAAGPLLAALAAQYGLDHALRVPPPGPVAAVITGIALFGGTIAALGVAGAAAAVRSDE
jgi:cell division transport system permease protein